MMTVDTSIFSAMCRELARKCAAPPDRALREEVGKVLSRAIELTPAADTSKIRAHAEQAAYTSQGADLYAPKFKARRHLVKGRVLYKMSHRYPDALWQKLQKARNMDLRKRLRARGLAKQSWLKIGELLGLSVQAPGYVRSAKASTGKEYDDERVRVLHTQGGIAYETENSQPTINAIGGDQILQRAIDGRVAFYLFNIKKDVFDEWDKIAKKYPGVTTTNG